ncbi:ATP-binding cassette domain-containing protein [Kyrpidia tusciae]|uniref:ABC transporter related protein n=1 Tax=Kyrpidia tusciae (strain DSM 2912 / NBRC 15312 / T2) TaxID=562970 RepID=D5WUV0_KYRT2|nr:ATP-binding cassette domain-containing protein [Kyrpidia tusciae]ADG07422.1 ABC transporter related protein [Kyrpidia tusciae DSM 2912]
MTVTSYAEDAGGSHSDPSAGAQPPLLEMADVVKRFVVKKRGLRVETIAADRISFSVRAGEVFGLVGESGSGKSTLAHLIMGLEEPDGGEIRFRGQILVGGGKRGMFPYGDIQMVFQDPRSSLEPRMRIRDIVLEPLRAVSPQRRREYGNDEALVELMRRVGLHPDHLHRLPHEFSGGQRQRIAIARALITRPALVILDEPTSALDVSVQAQVINLLKDLQQQFGLTYLFISHNMGLVKYFCDRVGVLYQGRLVEVGDADQIFTQPQEAYTQKLLESVPSVVV